METERVVVDRRQARDLYRQYKKHAAYSAPIDREIQRTYQLLAQGKTIIRAIESVRLAGLNDEYLPKLALAPATARACHIRRERTGAMIMSPNTNWWHNSARQFRFAQETFTFPVESFPIAPWAARPGARQTTSDHEALLPIIPIHLRPKRGLENYHVLWEAEWRRIPPKDPYLLRRIGKADLWLVVAAWDLTEVERAALATRITS